VVIGRDQEEVASLQPLDELGGVGASGDGVTQGRGEPVEDGCPEQELPDVGCLAIEHLFGQEIGDEPMVASELIDEAVR
jgi:hypothetical protein